MDMLALNSLLIVSLSVFRLSDVHARARCVFCILNLTQPVRTDLYAKMEMFA